MHIEIVNTPLEMDVYGFSTTASNGDYAAAAFRAMDKMWQVVKSNNLPNKGKNIWIYEPNKIVFAGVALESPPHDDTRLEHRKLLLQRYAYYKQVGPYSLLKQVGQAMNEEIKQIGLEAELPYVEIYGHWTNDETRLETELLTRVK